MFTEMYPPALIRGKAPYKPLSTTKTHTYISYTSSTMGRLLSSSTPAGQERIHSSVHFVAGTNGGSAQLEGQTDPYRRRCDGLDDCLRTMLRHSAFPPPRRLFRLARLHAQR